MYIKKQISVTRTGVTYSSGLLFDVHAVLVFPPREKLWGSDMSRLAKCDSGIPSGKLAESLLLGKLNMWMAISIQLWPFTSYIVVITPFIE